MGRYLSGTSFLVVRKDAAVGHAQGEHLLYRLMPQHRPDPGAQPGRCRAGVGPWHGLQGLCWGGTWQGKPVACETCQASVLQTVTADVSWQRVIILRGQGAAGKSRSVFLRQVGWLAARGMRYVFEKACQAQEKERRNISVVMRQAHPYKGGETTRWIPHQEAHIKSLVSSTAWREGLLKIGSFHKLLSLLSIFVCPCFSWLSWWHSWHMMTKICQFSLLARQAQACTQIWHLEDARSILQLLMKTETMFFMDNFWVRTANKWEKRTPASANCGNWPDPKI